MIHLKPRSHTGSITQTLLFPDSTFHEKLFHSSERVALLATTKSAVSSATATCREISPQTPRSLQPSVIH